jgi:hypothetical protein
MLREFIDFLNDYLDETGIVGLPKALLGILASGCTWTWPGRGRPRR